MMPSSTLRGIILIMISMAIAAFAGAIMKLLGEQIPAYLVAWFRFLGMSLLMLPYLIWRFGVSGLMPARPWMQLIRGLSMAGATTLFVIGTRTVDYADAIAVLYAYPFLLVIIAVLFLNERAGWSVWIGVTSGFVGVVLVIRPEFEEINTGAMLIFLCAVVLSIQLALSRRLGAVSPPLITAFSGSVCATIALTFFLPGNWQPIPDSAWLYICLLILSGTINQVLLVYAFADSDASTLAPFTYVEIVAAVMFGYLFFSTLPSVLSWMGIALIAISGIYVARAQQIATISRRVPKI
jgi:drug/metabolite transporter (DMT)-like permease